MCVGIVWRGGLRTAWYVLMVKESYGYVLDEPDCVRYVNLYISGVYDVCAHTK